MLTSISYQRRVSRSWQCVRWLSQVIRVKNNTAEGSCSHHELPTSTPLTWYACGPTVYDVAHIGHARTYVATDIIRRILTDYFHTPVNFAMGMTDIDDKIINRGKEEGYTTNTQFEALARKFEFEFLEDLQRLNVRSPDAILRVTEHIPQILTFISTLIEKKHAYVVQDGVYFDMSSLSTDFQYDRFGCVPPVAIDEDAHNGTILGVSTATATSTALPLTKRTSRDFALWKNTKSTDPGWLSPWGWGRPGWHIECSTMTFEYFGADLDIHSGGIDLQFPHHTNEIAQSECHHGQRWVQAWLHTGHLHIEGRKMSKSLKNFISIKDYFGFKLTSLPGDDFRIFCLLHKYTATLTYSEARLRDAACFRNKVECYFGFVDNLKQCVDVNNKYMLRRKPTVESKELIDQLQKAKQEVHAALSDDFDTPRALAAVGHIVGDAMQYATLVNNDIQTGNLQHPVEVLLSVEHYVRSMLTTFGLVFVQQGQHGRDEEHLQKNTSECLKSSIQFIVDFRSNLRNVATTGLKELKKVQKSEDCSNPETYKAMLDAQCKTILQITDKARAELGDSLHITIDDIGGSSSSWRLK